MRLSKEEFSIFSLASKVKIIENDGIFLVRKILDDTHEIKLFSLHDFYVEMFCNYKLNKVIQVNTVINMQWLEKFYMNIANRYNFS